MSAPRSVVEAARDAEAEVACLRPIVDAARAYVAARMRNDAAEPCDWSVRAAELERTWRDLVEASGLSLTPSETENQ